MNLKDSIRVLCVPGRGHVQSNVCAEWREEYCMKSHPLHSSIGTEWDKKLKESVHLFNASKFRLHCIDSQRTNTSVLPEIKLCVGTTCYKDFIGTNFAACAEKLSQDGIENSNNPQVYMSDPIGVGGLLMTSDRQLVFIRRSKKCAEMQGLIDRPGGHPEPDEAITSDAQSFKENPSAIVEEIFQSVLKEIRDEVNIPLQELSPPILLGVGYNPNTWGRPSMEFYVSCNLNGTQVLELYKKQTQAESDESSEVLFVPVSEILERDLEDLKFYDELTHPAKCALYLLKVYFS